MFFVKSSHLLRNGNKPTFQWPSPSSKLATWKRLERWARPSPSPRCPKRTGPKRRSKRRNGDKVNPYTHMGSMGLSGIFTPLKTNEFPLKSDHFSREYIWTNHRFSGDMLVFRGVATFKYIYTVQKIIQHLGITIPYMDGMAYKMEWMFLFGVKQNVRKHGKIFFWIRWPRNEMKEPTINQHLIT